MMERSAANFYVGDFVMLGDFFSPLIFLSFFKGIESNLLPHH
ncbi:unnamed protein product, partial [Vitis vinifera]|uniref:Uncharacterized protein n=1 Tax=Vitis vinifera TaxID=29760 RepID=E0CV76_VITVI